MARSRNIKPGLFTNDELAECNIYARFLFTGLWTIADKVGRLEDKPKKIKIMVLPYDNVDCDDLLNQLFKRGFIHRYSICNKNYIQIVNWKKHQNPHKNENESEIPGPALLDKENQQPLEIMEKKPSTENIDTPLADSLNLIDPQSAPIKAPEAYAFCGEIIKLRHADFNKWKWLYPNINLFHELSRLDLEFQHQKPKNWFITASQKINYQHKQQCHVKSINRPSTVSGNPSGFKVVNG